MLKHPFPVATASALLACVAALTLLGGVARLGRQLEPTAAARPPLPSPALQRCIENVNMVYDVQWAAACTAYAQEQRAALRSDAVDDSPDCTLPDTRAAMLNAARDADEAHCSAQSPP